MNFFVLTALLSVSAAVPALHTSADAILNRYIVTVNQGVDVQAHASAMVRRFADMPPVQKVYRVSPSYVVELDEESARKLRSDPDVQAVELNQKNIILFETENPSSRKKQANSLWGLATLSSRTPSAEDYLYDPSAGNGTFAYVIDSGLFVEHDDFEGRASFGKSFNGNDLDEHGHGTHVAGTLCGKTYGVAKKCNLIGVKVFGSDEPASPEIVMDGFEWAIEDILDKGREQVSVINASLGGYRISVALESMVKSAIARGISIVAAAGNDGVDACLVSPARVPDVITVGAIDESWHFSSTQYVSNFGKCVDILAPGDGILSASPLSSDATYVRNGTSMATPHVAGLVLYLKSLEGLETPKQVTSRILELATKGKVKGLPERTPNKLVYNGFK